MLIAIIQRANTLPRSNQNFMFGDWADVTLIAFFLFGSNVLLKSPIVPTSIEEDALTSFVKQKVVTGRLTSQAS